MKSSCSFPFLLLPLEIRLEIYKFALPYSEYRADLQLSDSPISWHPGACPRLLLANKHIYRETSSTLYQDNHFALYIRHPREPRLVYNESRADEQSFVLISWAHHHWAHPRNSKISWLVLRKHQNLQDIRRWYISIPVLDDLLGVEVYMGRSTIAGLHGIKFWLDKCTNNGGCLAGGEKKRMAYVQKYKDPIDEVGRMLQCLPQIDLLSLGLCCYGLHDIAFRDYMLDELLRIRGVKQAKCFYLPGKNGDIMIKPGPLETYRQTLQSPRGSFAKETPNLPQGIEEMYRLLEAMRIRQTIEPPFYNEDLIRE